MPRIVLVLHADNEGTPYAEIVLLHGTYYHLGSKTQFLMHYHFRLKKNRITFWSVVKRHRIAQPIYFTPKIPNNLYLTKQNALLSGRASGLATRDAYCAVVCGR